MNSRRKGFTILELLIVLAIIGIIAAIAIPNLLSALTRARARRTMADMRALATAWEARAADVQKYNAAGGVDGADVEVSGADLQTYLAPTYIKAVPLRDAWSKPMMFYSQYAFTDSNVSSKYGIVSAGQDGAFNPNIVKGPTTDFDCDIVYAQGAFLQYPDGMTAN